jgi:transcription initiation factor TFIIH subunit 2
LRSLFDLITQVQPNAVTIMSNAAVASSAPSGKEEDEDTQQHAWEETGEHSWESAVREDAEGNIILSDRASAADAIRRRRKRLELTDYAQRRRRVVRDMIRYLYVVVDASRTMREKDPVLPPGTKLECTLSLLQDFVQEYYDQNPLSHLGIVLVRNGEAEILTQLSSNAKSHKVALQSLSQLVLSEGPAKGGEFSLQNGLEVAGRSLGHQPRYGSREIVVLSAALSTCDPGHILSDTLPRLQAAGVRVSAFSLAAELYILHKIAEETGGVVGVCLDKPHFRDWLLTGQSVPPPCLQQHDFGCEMIKMGFPTRVSAEVPTLVHATRDTKVLVRTAYSCPQCQAKMSDLPSDCAVCGLKLVLAPHLARSFHHLFPVPAFSEISIEKSLTSGSGTETAEHQVISSSGPGMDKVELDSKLVASSAEFDRCCFGCLKVIGTFMDPPTGSKMVEATQGEELLRFQCPQCKNVFCADCDAFLHESLHNCPGCLTIQSTTQSLVH